MENLDLASELNSVSDKALEDLENMAVIYGLDALHDVVLFEMHKRPNFVPSSYSLQEVLDSMFG